MEATSSPPQPPKLSETQFDSSKTQMESSKSEAPEPQNSTEPVPDQTLGERDGDEEEEEGECGFCLFMKGGGCRESFVAWEKCIEEAEEKKEDIVDKCFEVTGALKKCMEAHSEYYAPILQAEKAAEAEAVRELEKEKERENGEREEVQAKNAIEAEAARELEKDEESEKRVREEVPYPEVLRKD